MTKLSACHTYGISLDRDRIEDSLLERSVATVSLSLSPVRASQTRETYSTLKVELTRDIPSQTT